MATKAATITASTTATPPPSATTAAMMTTTKYAPCSVIIESRFWRRCFPHRHNNLNRRGQQQDDHLFPFHVHGVTAFFFVVCMLLLSSHLVTVPIALPSIYLCWLLSIPTTYYHPHHHHNHFNNNNTTNNDDEQSADPRRGAIHRWRGRRQASRGNGPRLLQPGEMSCLALSCSRIPHHCPHKVSKGKG